MCTSLHYHQPYDTAKDGPHEGTAILLDTRRTPQHLALGSGFDVALENEGAACSWILDICSAWPRPIPLKAKRYQQRPKSCLGCSMHEAHDHMEYQCEKAGKGMSGGLHLSASMAAMTSPEVERMEMRTATRPGLDCWLAWGSVARAPRALGARVSEGRRRPDITSANGSPCGV